MNSERIENSDIQSIQMMGSCSELDKKETRRSNAMRAILWGDRLYFSPTRLGNITFKGRTKGKGLLESNLEAFLLRTWKQFSLVFSKVQDDEIKS